jgi:4-hydroxythreonine-4-phosphate dehydrogenase
MTDLDRPVAVTMGDPSGIGPEIVLKTLADPAFSVPTVVVGDAGILGREAHRLGLACEVRAIGEVGAATAGPGTANVFSESVLPEDLPVGRVDARAGRAAYRYIERAVALAQDGAVSAIATAPIHKAALKAAGVNFPGHTEILAALTGTEDYAMMLCNDELRVILVTIHLALRDAIESLTVARELKTIRLAHRAVQGLGIERPRVAVAGVNPHAGEDGLFGTEEAEIVAPAVAQARQEGIDVSGPWPGDAVFRQAREGRFDIVVAQYHDQGLIPVKYMGIDTGVNVTVGLPFIRTSVDHGTAFDIAGTGVADHTSLKVAIELAASMAAAARRVSVDR